MAHSVISSGVKNVLCYDCLNVGSKYVVHMSPQVICLYGVNRGIFSRVMHGCDVHTICPVCCWSLSGNRGYGLLSVNLTARGIKNMMPN